MLSILKKKQWINSKKTSRQTERRTEGQKDPNSLDPSKAQLRFQKVIQGRFISEAVTRGVI